MLIVDADPEICLYLHFCCRWLQIAKKMLAKSKKEGGSGFETSGKSTNGRRPLPHPASGQSLATVSQTLSILVSFNPPFYFSQSSSSTSSPPGGPSRGRSPSDVPAHLQRERERPHPGLQLQLVEALAGGEGEVQPRWPDKSRGVCCSIFFSILRL